MPTPLETSVSDAIQATQVEVHDVAFNNSLSLGGTRRLAVASDSGSVLSVSVIGDGPKVRRNSVAQMGSGGRPSYIGTTAEYPRIANTKVPKINPVRLPGINGNAYLIHSEAQGRYYFVDVSVNNGSCFRIAKVWNGRY